MINFPKTVWANNIIDQINISSRVVKNVFILDDRAKQEEELARLKSVGESVNQSQDSLERTIKSDEGKRLIASFKNIRNNEYYPVRDKMFSLLKNGERASAVNMMFGEFRNAQNRYIDAINNLINYQDGLVREAGIIADETYSFAFILNIILSIFALLFVLGAGYYIAKSITKPMNVVVDRVMQLESVCITNLGNGLTALENGDLNRQSRKSDQAYIV